MCHHIQLNLDEFHQVMLEALVKRSLNSDMTILENELGILSIKGDDLWLHIISCVIVVEMYYFYKLKQEHFIYKQYW